MMMSPVNGHVQVVQHDAVPALDVTQFRRLLAILHDDLTIPFSSRIQKLLDKRVEAIESGLLDDLHIDAKILISLDCWTSSNNFKFLASRATTSTPTGGFKKCFWGLNRCEAGTRGPRYVGMTGYIISMLNISTSVGIR